MLRGKIYYLRQRIGGKDCWRSLNTTDKREAQYLALEFWRQRQSDRIKAIIPAPPMLLGQVWDNYTRNDRFKDLADSTKDTKSRTWSTFANWCACSKIAYPEQLTRDFVVKYLSSGERKNKTFNNILNDLRTAFQYGGASCNPFTEIEPLLIHRGVEEKRSEQFRAFTDDEMDRIETIIQNSKMKYRDEWLLAAQIARNTGLRYKDVALLRWDQIQADEVGQYIELSPHKTATKTGGKVVYIRLVSDLSTAFAIWRMSHNDEFILAGLADNYNDKTRAAANPFANLCRRAGINGSFHCYRVSIVTKAARGGVNLEEFGGVVGHSTETQTRAYNRAALNINMEQILAIRLA